MGGIAGKGVAFVLVMAKIFDTCIFLLIGLDHFRGIVRRAIVHNHKLQLRIGLIQDGIQCPGKEMGTVVGGEIDADEGIHVFAPRNGVLASSIRNILKSLCLASMLTLAIFLGSASFPL